jgi:hypothetical protein
MQPGWSDDELAERFAAAHRIVKLDYELWLRKDGDWLWIDHSGVHP